ncbi:MAG: DUF2141 domain-containing protein [Rhodanobacteraceae bacterium]|nr:DUF2141 domain-containing protein [Rhodanobacteraceae bacterium]
MKADTPLILVSALLACTNAAQAGSLAIEIGDGIKPGETLMVALYDSEAQWLKKSARGIQEAAPADLGSGGKHTLRVDALAPGRYAVVVYVDRNGNGKLDRGMFGRPIEPYGFSNGGGSFGPPDFADAVIDVADTGAAIHIDLN